MYYNDCDIYTGPKWRLEIFKNKYDLTTDLAPVAAGLILKLCSIISDVEYYKIMGESNPVDKMSILLEAICSRRDDRLYGQLCDAVEEVKFNELANKLRSFL